MLRVLREEVPVVFFCLLLPLVLADFLAVPVFEDVVRVDLEAIFKLTQDSGTYLLAL